MNECMNRQVTPPLSSKDHALIVLPSTHPPTHLRNHRAIINLPMRPPGQGVVPLVLPKKGRNTILLVRRLPPFHRGHVTVYPGGKGEENEYENTLPTPSRFIHSPLETRIALSPSTPPIVYLLACRHTATRRLSSAMRAASSGVAMALRSHAAPALSPPSCAA